MFAFGYGGWRAIVAEPPALKAEPLIGSPLAKISIFLTVRVTGAELVTPMALDMTRVSSREMSPSPA